MEEWYERLEAGFGAVFSKMNDQHLKMVFALNMICEHCLSEDSLTDGFIHKMALYGLGYDHEEENEEVKEEAQL